MEDFPVCEENDLSWAGGKETGKKAVREGENTAHLWNGSWLAQSCMNDVYVLVTFSPGFWQVCFPFEKCLEVLTVLVKDPFLSLFTAALNG